MSRWPGSPLDGQLVIPGLESLAPAKPKRKARPPTVRQQLTSLQRQVAALEMDVMLMRLEAGEYAGDDSSSL